MWIDGVYLGLKDLTIAIEKLKRRELMEIGNWVVIQTKRGNIEGEVTKINSKTFIVKLRLSGTVKHIKRTYNQLVEICDF